MLELKKKERKNRVTIFYMIRCDNIEVCVEDIISVLK